MTPNLKSPAGRRQLIGKPLDNVLDIAAKSGYGCHVIYHDLTTKEQRRKELIVYVTNGIVTKIR